MSERPLARKTFELPTFLGETVPVFAVRLRGWRLEDNALVMACDTVPMFVRAVLCRTWASGPVTR